MISSTISTRHGGRIADPSTSTRTKIAVEPVMKMVLATMERMACVCSPAAGAGDAHLGQDHRHRAAVCG